MNGNIIQFLIAPERETSDARIIVLEVSVNFIHMNYIQIIQRA